MKNIPCWQHPATRGHEMKKRSTREIGDQPDKPANGLVMPQRVRHPL
jgi:hypothetical protein